MKKLSEQLHDAYLLDNYEEVERIKGELEMRKVARSDAVTPTKINTVLNDEKSSAIKVYDFLNRAFGPDWWEWEWETIERLLWVKYGTALEEVNRDKVFAIRHVCRSDGAFSDWYEFNQVALSFSGSIADFEFLKQPSPGMVVNAVKTLNHIRPDRESFFSNDVIKYMCIVFINDGIYVPPPSLISIIKDTMKNMVSNSESWLDVYKRYNQFSNKNYSDIKENPVDIQAKRIFKTENSALIYNS